jgi:hypothetical protein
VSNVGQHNADIVSEEASLDGSLVRKFATRVVGNFLGALMGSGADGFIVWLVERVIETFIRALAGGSEFNVLYRLDLD